MRGVRSTAILNKNCLHIQLGVPLSYENVAVITLCYNEDLTIGKVMDGYARELPGATVYVYDNSSGDGTAEVARFEPRQDKGNVCRQMFPASRPTATSWSTATTPTTRPGPARWWGPSLPARPT